MKCPCGCKKKLSEGKRYFSRSCYDKARRKQALARREAAPRSPCKCGCGKQTPPGRKFYENTCRGRYMRAWNAERKAAVVVDKAVPENGPVETHRLSTGQHWQPLNGANPRDIRLSIIAPFVDMMYTITWKEREQIPDSIQRIMRELQHWNEQEEVRRQARG